MRRLTAEDYAVDAVTGAKALVGAWLCRGSAHRHRLRLEARPKPQVALHKVLKSRRDVWFMGLWVYGFVGLRVYGLVGLKVEKLSG